MLVIVTCGIGVMTRMPECGSCSDVGHVHILVKLAHVT